MSQPIADALMDAWFEVKPKLLADPDELRARLARRRSRDLTRPPRSACVAVRACDRRLTPMDVAMSPYEAANRADPGEHTVVLTAEAVRWLTAPLTLMMWRGWTLREFAAKVGVHPDSLHYQRKRGYLNVDYIAGLGGQRGKPVPLIWARDHLDPGSCSAFRPPHTAWGARWQNLAEALPDDFEQPIRRAPAYALHSRTRQPVFAGWRWICPGCRRPVRMVYYPVRQLTLMEWLGDEAAMLRRAGADPETDGIARGPTVFACNTCHRVAGWSSLRKNHWNKLVAYMSGGLLYGREVQRPDELAPVRYRRPRGPVDADPASDEEA